MNKKTQGKKNRASGAAFERLVRKDLESKGWIVSKWMNNVEFHNEELNDLPFVKGKLIPAKHKFNPFMKVMAIGTGFPDFIVFSPADSCRPKITGVESKMNGILDKQEKEKCKWLLDNQVFSKILIAKKGKRGIEYVEYKRKD